MQAELLSTTAETHFYTKRLGLSTLQLNLHWSIDYNALIRNNWFRNLL